MTGAIKSTLKKQCGKCGRHSVTCVLSANSSEIVRTRKAALPPFCSALTFFKREWRKTTLNDLSSAPKRVALEQGINLMVRTGALTLHGINPKQEVKIEWKSKKKK